MKTASMSPGKDYVCSSPWPEDIFLQCGESGIVFVRGGKNYQTAFFEAFPKKPSCFLRGEGSSVEEAEKACWEKYQKVISCNHVMERRNRTDGYGYCKYCSYSSTVFEPLTKCCKCKVPTAYSQDFRGKYYCKKHSRYKPSPKKTDKNSTLMERMLYEKYKKRLPRKEKKLLKLAVTYKFRKEGHTGLVIYHGTGLPSFTCDGFKISFLLEKQKRKVILDYLKSKR